MEQPEARWPTFVAYHHNITLQCRLDVVLVLWAGCAGGARGWRRLATRCRQDGHGRLRVSRHPNLPGGHPLTRRPSDRAAATDRDGEGVRVGTRELAWLVLGVQAA